MKRVLLISMFMLLFYAPSAVYPALLDTVMRGFIVVEMSSYRLKKVSKKADKQILAMLKRPEVSPIVEARLRLKAVREQLKRVKLAQFDRERAASEIEQLERQLELFEQAYAKLVSERQPSTASAGAQEKHEKKSKASRRSDVIRKTSMKKRESGKNEKTKAVKAKRVKKKVASVKRARQKQNMKVALLEKPKPRVKKAKKSKSRKKRLTGVNVVKIPGCIETTVVGAFKYRKNAFRMLERLDKYGVRAGIVKRGRLYLVVMCARNREDVSYYRGVAIQVSLNAR